MEIRTLNDGKQRFKSSWIITGLEPGFDDYAKSIGKYLSDKGLSSSQLRNIFNEIKRLEMIGLEDNMGALSLLNAKVAYMAARAKNNEGSKAFKEIFSLAYEQVKSVDQEKTAYSFKNLAQFIEGIIAYHKVEEELRKQQQH